MAGRVLPQAKGWELLKHLSAGYDASYRVNDTNGFTEVLKLVRMGDIINTAGDTTNKVDCVTIKYLLDANGFKIGHVTVIGKTLEDAELTALYNAYITA